MSLFIYATLIITENRIFGKGRHNMESGFEGGSV